MSDLTIGAVGGAAIASQLSPVSPSLGSLLQLDQHLDIKLADAFEAALYEILEEKKASAKIEAVETESIIDVQDDERVLDASQRTMGDSDASSDQAPPARDPREGDLDAGVRNPQSNDALTATPANKDAAAVTGEVKADQDHTVETAAENLRAAEVLQSRALEVMDQFRDELVRRAPDISLLRENELVGFARSLLSDDPLEVTWRARQDALGQEAAETRDALTRLAERLTGRWPQAATDACAEHISTEVAATVDAAKADRMATDILAGSGADSISQLVVRSTDPGLDPEAQRAATLDAYLAMAYAERLLNEQASAARRAVEADLQQLPAVSQARKSGEAMLAIADRFPESQAETRKAVEAYYDSLALQQGSHVAAWEVLNRLLASQDDGLLGYVVQLAREASFDPRVAQALSIDPEVSARARRQIEQADCEVQRERPRRVSPFEGELPGPASADFHLAKTEVFDAVRAAILNLDNPVEAVELHAEGRLQTVFTVLELIDALKEQGVVEPASPVAVGGALFQLGKGSRAEESEAAHKLAGQVYIGIDPDTAAKLDEEQLRQYRLDTLLESDKELESVARVQAASTTVLPSYVNKVDSLWESKGLRDAFERAASELMNQPAGDTAAVVRAYETFRAGAAEALQAAYDHNRAKLEQLEAERSAASAAQSIKEAHLARMQDAIEVYQAVVAETDAQQARQRMLDWLATVWDRKDQR